MGLSVFLARIGILSYLPVEKSTFFSLPFPENLKLSKEIVKINYKRYSPFKNSEVLYIVENGFIYLWFYEAKKDSYKPLLIPESYVIYKEFYSQKNVSVYVAHPMQRFYLLKNGHLKVAVSPQGDVDALLKVSQAEYGIENIFKLDPSEYGKLYDKAKEKLSAKDYFKFLQFDFSFKESINFIVDRYTYLISFLIILYIGISYAQSYFLEKKSSNLEKELYALKEQNLKIKESIREYNENIEKLNEFSAKELAYPDHADLLFEIYKVFSTKDKARLILFQADTYTLNLWIETEKDIGTYIEKLNRVDKFEQVLLKSSRNSKGGKKIYIIEIFLRALNEKS